MKKYAKKLATVFTTFKTRLSRTSVSSSSLCSVSIIVLSVVSQIPCSKWNLETHHTRARQDALFGLGWPS
jgi:hypothetical protein